jgi:RNA polymerase sigma-70 factor, ECF subfamily
VNFMPTTHASLMVRLKNDSNNVDWHRFVQLYQPALIRWLSSKGLQDSDADDCVQQILLSVTRALDKFTDDGRPASFRRWLQTIARNELINSVRQRSRQPQSNRESHVWQELMNLTQNNPALDSSLQWEYERQVFIQAAAVVRKSIQESSWEAFWRTTILGQSAAHVANELGMNEGAVYMAKGRVLVRLKQVVFELEQQS